MKITERIRRAGTCSFALAAMSLLALAQSVYANTTFNKVETKTAAWSDSGWFDIASGANGILTNNYDGTVTIGTNLDVGRSGNGVRGEYVQNAGTMNVGGDFVVGFTDSLTALAVLNAGALNVTGDIYVTKQNGNPTASLVVNGGSFTGCTGSDKKFYFKKGAMTVNSGTVDIGNDFKMGELGAATLTINGGTMTVKYWTRLESSNYARTINLNGGTFHTYRINTHGGTGAATVNFNGGTLRIKANDGTVIGSGVTVKVKSNGGTIDVNGMTATNLASFVEDSSSTGGGMKFIGGGTLTLEGSIGYTGGTTIEPGTTIAVGTAAKKDALLGSGLNTLKVIPAVGTFTLVTITGSDTFTSGDELKAAVADGYNTDAVFSISGDGKSLMVTIGNIYDGGEINQSSPTLVFPGASLADLATHTLRARMQGDWFDDDGVEATFFNRVETEDNGVLTKVTYQLQAIDGSQVKATKVEFTADGAGVYAKIADGNYSNYSGDGTTLNKFGNDPLADNAGTGHYYPCDFRLVAPANAISMNFTHNSKNLDSSSSVRYGGGDYAVPYSSWGNMPANNNQTATIGGATVKITGTRGSYLAEYLGGSKNLLHGYIDDSDSYTTPTVTVTNIPYEFYRVVAYASTETDGMAFGYITINGKNYTGTADATVEGTANWGSAGGAKMAKGLREGVNYLVSDVVSGSSATIIGHRFKSGSAITARSCLAAIQIVEYVPTTYTATISDGGSKSLSALSWDNALPSLLTANDRVVVNVNEDTTLNIDIPVDVYGITFNVASGKTLTLSGNNILAYYITATGAGQTVVASASQLAGTVKGDGTLVYDGVRPTTTGTDIVLTDPLWTGTVVIKGYNKGNSATGNARALFPQFWGSANSKIKWNGVCGYFGGCTSAAGWILEDLEDGGTTYPALTKNDGGSSSLTTAPSLEGTGTFADASNPTERFKFVNADNFTGTISITSAAGKGMNVQFGATAVAVTPGVISVLSGATATVAAGKTWTAQGGMVVDGTLMLGAGAAAPAVVSGTGTVGVTSGTGTLNGYGAAAVLTLATAPGATLAIVDAGLATMTVGAFNNMGTIDLTGTALTEATLNLGSGVTAAATGTILYPATFQKFVVSPADKSVRSLADYTTVPTLPEGAAYYVTLTETREEFGKGSMTVTNCAAGVNVRAVRPNGTVVDFMSTNGTAALSEAAQIAGEATAFDATYTNTVAYAYRAPGWNAGSGRDVSPATYNNTDNDETTGMYILHHPWVSGVEAKLNALSDFTLVVVGTMSPSKSTQFLHMGNTSSGVTGILITTTENEDEVLIAKNTGNSVDAANGVKASVPNAASARHAYVINKKGSAFEVWVDGVKRGQFDAGEGFALGTSGACGIQVGSDHGGNIKNAGIYKGVPNDPPDSATETGVVNLIRLFDYSISDAQAEAVFNTYPYVSQGGLYTRTVTADGTFSQTDAWEKDGSAGTFDVPMGATVDGVAYNPSATLTVNAAAEIEVNASVSIETLTVGGTAPVTFTADGTHAVTVVGAAIINAPVTNEYGALNITGAPLQLGSSGAICFDLSGMDTSGLYAEGYVQLTGLTDRNDEKVTAILPTDPDRTFALAYNTSLSCYVLNVTPLHNYIVAENKMTTSPTITNSTDNIVLGTGGFDIGTLAIPENAKIVLDPIKTPFYVWGTTAGSFTIGNGAKFALSTAYSGMTLGRIVLLTYKDTTVTLPANLNDLFDETSIASETFAVTCETFQNQDGEVKQLVLTVGAYASNAKEIVVMSVGDSITQGVNNPAQGDNNPQYRTSIAAYLAANGYKPKFRGIWRYSDRSGANVQAPDDWAYHCGFGCAAIRTTASSGGLADNMPFYLDIAGYPDVITLLIGTNDLGMNNKEAGETFTNYVALVNATAAQRPDAKIIGATLLPRPGAAGEKVVAFNALLSAEYAKSGKGDLPDNFFLLDLYPLVPNDELANNVTGNYAADNLHPNWKGHAIIAEAFYGKIVELLPLATFAGAGDATVTDAPQTALGATNIADLAAYRFGMTQIFTIEKDGAAGATNCFTTAPYTSIENSSALTRGVSKVGYFFELVRKGTNRRRWVWVDMDATGKTLGEVDFPWNNANMQRIATKLHVKSNYAGIHDVAPDNDSISGIVEGTKWNYGNAAAIEGAPADIFGTAYGWNDTMASSTSGGHACFQVHRIFSQEAGDTHWNDAEVLFAWNRWGYSTSGNVDEIGIGPFHCHVEAVNKKNSDYTNIDVSYGNFNSNVYSDAYSVRRLEIWATLEGEPRHGVWSGAGMDGDFDTAANWEDGVVPSAGDDIDFSALPAATTIAVTGASTNKTFGTATMGSSIVTFTGTVTFTGISDTSKIAVGADSTVTFDGDLEFSGSGNHYVAYTVAAGGKFVVTGDVIALSDFTGYIFHSKTSGGGVVQARGLVNNATSNSDNWAFRLNAEDAPGTAYWTIGDHGLSGSRFFWTNGDHPVEVRPLNSGFTISTRMGLNSEVTFNTTGADGNPYTITVGNDGNGYIGNTGTANVTGTGKVLVDAVNTLSGAVNVNGTATLAINPEKVMTTGAITVSSNATLQVTQSGTVALGGNLTLADGAILGFNYTDKDSAPVLDATGKTVTFGEQANVVVKVTAANGSRPKYKHNPYVLTSGGGFTGANLTLDAGSADWAKDINVNEAGNIILNVKSSGIYILVR